MFTSFGHGVQNPSHSKTLLQTSLLQHVYIKPFLYISQNVEQQYTTVQVLFRVPDILKELNIHNVLGTLTLELETRAFSSRFNILIFHFPTNASMLLVLFSLLTEHTKCTLTLRLYPGGRGGVLKKVLYGKAPPSDPTPNPFIYHFWQKRYPFHILSIENGTPFIYLP